MERFLQPTIPSVPDTAPDRDGGGWFVPWGLGTALGAVGISYAVYLTGQIGLGVVVTTTAGAGAVRHNLTALEIGSYQFLVAGIILAAAVLVVARYRHGLQLLGYRFPGWSVLLGAAAAGLASALLGSAAISWIFDTFLPAYQLHGNTKELIPFRVGSLPVWKIVLLFLWVAVEAPVAEETLFRGMIFGGLNHLFSRCIPRAGAVFGAAVCSGLLFGLAHFEIHTLPVLFFMGVILAYVYYYGRSIYASAILHALINASSLVTLFHR